jgi:hypothetical protein
VGTAAYKTKCRTNKNLFGHIGYLAPLLAAAAALHRRQPALLLQVTYMTFMVAMAPT